MVFYSSVDPSLYTAYNNGANIYGVAGGYGGSSGYGSSSSGNASGNPFVASNNRQIQSGSNNYAGNSTSSVWNSGNTINSGNTYNVTYQYNYGSFNNGPTVNDGSNGNPFTSNTNSMGMQGAGYGGYGAYGNGSMGINPYYQPAPFYNHYPEMMQAFQTLGMTSNQYGYNQQPYSPYGYGNNMGYGMGMAYPQSYMPSISSNTSGLLNTLLNYVRSMVDWTGNTDALDWSWLTGDEDSGETVPDVDYYTMDEVEDAIGGDSICKEDLEDLVNESEAELARLMRQSNPDADELAAAQREFELLEMLEARFDDIAQFDESGDELVLTLDELKDIAALHRNLDDLGLSRADIIEASAIVERRETEEVEETEETEDGDEDGEDWTVPSTKSTYDVSTFRTFFGSEKFANKAELQARIDELIAQAEEAGSQSDANALYNAAHAGRMLLDNWDTVKAHLSDVKNDGGLSWSDISSIPGDKSLEEYDGNSDTISINDIKAFNEVAQKQANLEANLYDWSDVKQVFVKNYTDDDDEYKALTKEQLLEWRVQDDCWLAGSARRSDYYREIHEAAQIIYYAWDNGLLDSKYTADGKLTTAEIREMMEPEDSIFADQDLIDDALAMDYSSLSDDGDESEPRTYERPSSSSYTPSYRSYSGGSERRSGYTSYSSSRNTTYSYRTSSSSSGRRTGSSSRSTTTSQREPRTSSGYRR